MAPTAAELHSRLRTDNPLIPTNVLDMIVEVYQQDPAYVKALARAAETKERRGRGEAKAGRPIKQRVVEQKAVAITPFSEFMRENPSVFGGVYDEHGIPRPTLETVAELSPATEKDDAVATIQCS